MPRKLKKDWLGKRLRKSQLKKLLSTVKIIKGCHTMHDRPVIEPYMFCPHCGCTGMYGSGNKAGYPEHWEYFYCLRCKKIVGYIDNSPFIHALECKEFGYDPVF